MSSPPQSFQDLLDLLRQHPEWRQQLYELVVPEEQRNVAGWFQRSKAESDVRMGELERALVELAQAQRRTEEQMAALAEAQRRTDAEVAELVKAQRRSEERLARLEATVEALAEAQRRAEERLAGVEERLARAEERLAGVEERLARLEAIVEALAEAQRRTEEQIAKLAIQVKQNTDQLGNMKGRLLEMDYHRKAGAIFGPYLRRARVVNAADLADELRSRLSMADLKELLRTDLMVRGFPVVRPDLPEVVLAVEVSSVVDQDDVSRARRRAELLAECGYLAVPMVAGETITQGAREEVAYHKVVALMDGQIEQWEAALEKLAPPAQR